MTNFEKITKDAETMAEWMAGDKFSLPHPPLEIYGFDHGEKRVTAMLDWLKTEAEDLKNEKIK